MEAAYSAKVGKGCTIENMQGARAIGASREAAVTRKHKDAGCGHRARRYGKMWTQGEDREYVHRLSSGIPFLCTDWTGYGGFGMEAQAMETQGMKAQAMEALRMHRVWRHRYGCIGMEALVWRHRLWRHSYAHRYACTAMEAQACKQCLNNQCL